MIIANQTMGVQWATTDPDALWYLERKVHAFWDCWKATGCEDPVLEDILSAQELWLWAALAREWSVMQEI